MRFAEKKNSYYDLDNTDIHKYIHTYLLTVHKHCQYVHTTEPSKRDKHDLRHTVHTPLGNNEVQFNFYVTYIHVYVWV